MDNAVVIDGVLVIALVVGTVLGAHRGLIKSLMGFLVVVGAFIGAVLLADALTGPITDAVAPKVEDAVVEKFAEVVEKGTEEDGGAGAYDLTKLLESLGLTYQTVRSIINPLDDAQDWEAAAKEKAVAAFREVISPTVWSLVRGAVHAALLLLLYIALTVALKLVLRAVDLVFDLPVLSTLNGVGGAVLGFLEAAVLISVALYVGSRLGVKLVTEHMKDTLLLPLFLDRSPIGWISSLKTEVWQRDRII